MALENVNISSSEFIVPSSKFREQETYDNNKKLIRKVSPRQGTSVAEGLRSS